MSGVSFVIAIDGTAASGKGTLARRIAGRYHLPYLDTGLTYRAVAHALLQKHLPLDDEACCVALAKEFDISNLDRNVLSRHEIGEIASKIAPFAALRAVLVEKQRQFSQQMPGAVLDGRDIGSVVAPDAAVKFYVTASLEERARRRYHEMISAGEVADLAQVKSRLQARDMRDSNRASGPLRQVQDAHLLDTTKLSIEEVFALGVHIVDTKRQEIENRRHALLRAGSSSLY